MYRLHLHRQRQCAANQQNSQKRQLTTRHCLVASFSFRGTGHWPMRARARSVGGFISPNIEDQSPVLVLSFPDPMRPTPTPCTRSRCPSAIVMPNRCSRFVAGNGHRFQPPPGSLTLSQKVLLNRHKDNSQTRGNSLKITRNAGLFRPTFEKMHPKLCVSGIHEKNGNQKACLFLFTVLPASRVLLQPAQVLHWQELFIRQLPTMRAISDSTFASAFSSAPSRRQDQ